MNQTVILEKYDKLSSFIGLKRENRHQDLFAYIKRILADFMSEHRRVGVYCYGYHTHMLFTDFVAELRNIVCIIDNGNMSNDSDFKIIKDGDIEKYDLDGIIISSYKYRNEIKRGLRDNHKSVDALDLYEELQKSGVFLEHEFYCAGPYHAYSSINSLIRQIEENPSIELLKILLQEYINIKEFRLADELSEKIYAITNDDRDKEIHEFIKDLYEAEIKQLARIGKDNILLLCLDGMRRSDFFQGGMKKTYELLKGSSSIYKNAYSYSTMTYEALVPVFEENSDQKTEYYLREEVEAKNCRFMKKALDEGRFVAVYGDGNHYIYDERIKYIGNSQTITEKLWDFIIDTDGVDKGIFYLHELYESHYSFINPYTKMKLVAQGSAMLFDFLPQNSGKLRTDYKMQQRDALRYLDDTLAPFIEVLPCNMVLFADHGNIVLEPGTEIKDIEETQLHVAEDWIQIPLVIKTNTGKNVENRELISLMEMNNIVLSVMSGNDYEPKSLDYIKIGRSEIYNQQFKELYRLLKTDYNGEAFEGFIFQDGYKLIIFSDGRKILFRVSDDVLVEDMEKIEKLFYKVKTDISIF